MHEASRQPRTVPMSATISLSGNSFMQAVIQQALAVSRSMHAPRLAKAKFSTASKRISSLELIARVKALNSYIEAVDAFNDADPQLAGIGYEVEREELIGLQDFGSSLSQVKAAHV